MPALAALNHLLQQNPEIRAQMQTHAERCVRLVLPVLALTARIDAQGYWRHSNDAPETTLTFHGSALQKRLQGGTPGVGDVAVAGDQNLGMALLPLLGGLRYWANDDIARLFGDAAAGEWLRVSGSLKHSAAELAQTVAAHISDYAQETDAAVVHRQQFARFAEKVATLRDDVARLEARLRQFKHNSD